MDFLLGSLRVVDFILLQRTLTRSTCVCNLLAQHLENELEHREFILAGLSSGWFWGLVDNFGKHWMRN